MDINTLAAWGEFLGGIGVIASLIYLAGQIRQNSKLLRVSATVSLGESDIEFSKVLLQDPEVSRIYRQGSADRESLSETERDRFDAWLDMMMRSFQKVYFVKQAGAMPPALWQGERRSNAWIIQQHGAEQWWSENRSFYCDEFGALLDCLIREGQAAG